jgi:hypothetical protein
MTTISWSDLDNPPTTDFTATVEPSASFELGRIFTNAATFYDMDLKSSIDFDYETTTSYEVTVVVSDAEYTTEHHFLIEIVNEDDELPTDILLNGVPVGCDGVKFSDLVFDDCGVCGGDGSSCRGCTDSAGCNYAATNSIDDGSCTYAATNYDCAGNCIVAVDCAGTCAGSVAYDSCGVCGGSGPATNYDCAGNCIAGTDCFGTCAGSAVTDSCGVCNGDGTACVVSMSYGGSTNYLNDWDDELNYACGGIYGLTSVHDNGKEDRLWAVECITGGLPIAWTSWSGTVNDWDDVLDYTCPQNQIVTGLNSWHDN